MCIQKATDYVFPSSTVSSLTYMLHTCGFTQLWIKKFGKNKAGVVVHTIIPAPQEVQSGRIKVQNQPRQKC
jgi:hypothetical protein